MKKRYILTAIAVFAIMAALLNAVALAAATKKKDPSINWSHDFDKAAAQAKKLGKPMMVDFYADWCGPCKKLNSETFADEKVIELSGKFVCVKIDVDQNQALAKKYKVEGIPNVVFMNSNGKEIMRSVGYKNADDFLKVMKSALAKAK
jgi:thiol:disulfide interchange protein DsbD